MQAFVWAREKRFPPGNLPGNPPPKAPGAPPPEGAPRRPSELAPFVARAAADVPGRPRARRAGGVGDSGGPEHGLPPPHRIPGRTRGSRSPEPAGRPGARGVAQVRAGAAPEPGWDGVRHAGGEGEGGGVCASGPRTGPPPRPPTAPTAPTAPLRDRQRGGGGSGGKGGAFPAAGGGAAGGSLPPAMIDDARETSKIKQSFDGRRGR